MERSRPLPLMLDNALFRLWFPVAHRNTSVLLTAYIFYTSSFAERDDPGKGRSIASRTADVKVLLGRTRCARMAEMCSRTPHQRAGRSAQTAVRHGPRESQLGDIVSPS